MTAPALIASAVLACTLAAGYHLLFGRSLQQLAAFVVASLLGFAVGHLASEALAPQLPRLGQVYVAGGIGGSLLLMSIVKSIRF